MTEKQLKKQREKAEYEKQKLNGADEKTSYPWLASIQLYNKDAKYSILYPIYNVIAPLKKSLPNSTIIITSSVLSKPEN